jgi:hypothetical protein
MVKMLRVMYADGRGSVSFRSAGRVSKFNTGTNRALTHREGLAGTTPSCGGALRSNDPMAVKRSSFLARCLSAFPFSHTPDRAKEPLQRDNLPRGQINEEGLLDLLDLSPLSDFDARKYAVSICLTSPTTSRFRRFASPPTDPRFAAFFNVVFRSMRDAWSAGPRPTAIQVNSTITVITARTRGSSLTIVVSGKLVGTNRARN